jgi:hypothetical protein
VTGVLPAIVCGMRRTARCVGLGLLLLGTSCAGRDVPLLSAAITPLPGLRAVPLSTSVGSQTPNLNVGRDGEVILTWQDTSPAAVRWSRHDDDGWSAPAVVTDEAGLLVNWADFPAMMTQGPGTLVATWLQRFEGGAGYGVRWARSADDGAQWGGASWLPLSTSGPEYGFVSLAPVADGRLAVFWLDGRQATEDGGAMQLRAAQIEADGTIGARRQVDDRVCDCCQTSAASTAVGPVVVYRDRSADEVRDIAIAGPKPDRRRSVARDDWTIAGCPVNGPAVSASSAGLAVAWYSAASDHPAVRVAFAPTEGEFEAPVDVDLGRPLGRVDVEWLDPQHAIVSFLERDPVDDKVAVLVARTVRRDGARGAPWRVATTSASNASGFPRLARGGDDVVWAWTSVDGDSTRVHVAEAAIAGLLPG